MVKIPTNEKIEMLITYASKNLATKLLMSKETGLRPIELCNLKVKDIDINQRIVYPTTAKHGSPRALKISTRLQEMLIQQITKHNLKPEDKLFKGDPKEYGKLYRSMRANLANKMNDQSYRTIKLYDFRHYFATHTYDVTKDILYTKQQMGHKRIQTTMIYTQLIAIEQDGEYTCKIAKTIEEAIPLIEAGFTQASEYDGIKIFKKRK
jgi:integrase